LRSHPDGCTDCQIRTQEHEKKIDWAKYFGTASLRQRYANARCLKDEIYRRWLDNLGKCALADDRDMAREAARRIDYIEQNLFGATRGVKR
jgi:hypothetical protein